MTVVVASVTPCGTAADIVVWCVVQVHVLHGLQSAELQRKVFRRTNPGEWKIVLTTNIGTTLIGGPCCIDYVH